MNIFTSVVMAMLCIVLAAACSKIEKNELPYITFGVSPLGVETKGLISSATFTSQPIYVYGVRNNTESIYNKALITKEQDSNNWLPATKKQWVAGSSYSFYGYTCSGNSYTIANNGLKITVEQPTSYVPANMVDYLLSHAYKVADGSNYHTVALNMEHAMACVDIIVEKEEKNHNVTLTNLTLRNIYTQAIMQCESQGIVGSTDNKNNVWATQLQGTNNAVYTTSGQVSGHTIGTMTFLAIPQQLSSATTLEIGYSVTENSQTNEYSQTFQLYNYTPYVWESGHRITYTLTINTGVQLKAHIADWVDAGYTEGVILPTNGNQS